MGKLDINGTYTVTVKRYYKTLERRHPVTNQFEKYRQMLDWDFGLIDGGNAESGEWFVLGPPTQLTTALVGDPVNDPRILETYEQLPLSQREGTATDMGGEIHFKHPNI